MDKLFHTSVKGVVIRDGCILLVQYDEEGVGVHYNLPGGRQKKDETLHQALRRKMMEEAGADVEVGPFLFLYEFIGRNHPNPVVTGHEKEKHSVSMVFQCTLKPGSKPGMDTCTKPDLEFQIGVRWVPLDEFRTIQFWPSVPERIIELASRPRLEDRYFGDIL